MEVILLSRCSERQMRIMKRPILWCLLVVLSMALLGCREKGIDYEAYQKVLDEVNAEYETYFTFEQLPPNEKWDIKSYEEFAVDCAKKIVEYRADCEKYGTTMEELLKNFDDKMGALPDDDFQAASD